MAVNTFGDIGNATAGWYVRELLSHAVPIVILDKLGAYKPLPKNETKVIEFRRSIAFEPATTPLVEGVTPDGSEFGYNTLSCQIQQYGDWTEITDVVADTSKDPVLEDILERQVEQVAATRERLDWDIVRAGTSVAYGGNMTARNQLNHTSAMTSKMARQATTNLKNNKAKVFTRILDASPNYQTRAVEAAYVAVCHSNLDSTLRDLRSEVNQRNTFKVVADYGNVHPISPFELGSFENARYITSPDLPEWKGAGATATGHTDEFWNTTISGTAKFDVYPIVFLGRKAFACIPLKGKRSVRPMILNPNVPRGSDPLGQRGTAAWKMWYACMITNDEWMRRAEVTVNV